MLKKMSKESRYRTFTFHKIKVYIKVGHRPKGKDKPIKFQEDNVGDLGEHGFGNEFLYITPKAHSVKKKKLISGTS